MVRGHGRSLLVPKLLAAFQEYFRENSEHWVDRFGYKEAGPQQQLQAFLQRIVNSGGRTEREDGLGRMRTDLLLVWPVKGEGGGPLGLQKAVIECKLLRGSREATLTKGLAQTGEYMDRAGTDEGHLVIFDRTEGLSWDERIYRHEGRGRPQNHRLGDVRARHRSGRSRRRLSSRAIPTGRAELDL